MKLNYAEAILKFSITSIILRGIETTKLLNIYKNPVTQMCLNARKEFDQWLTNHPLIPQISHS